MDCDPKDSGSSPDRHPKRKVNMIISFPPPPPGGNRPKSKKVARPYWITMLYEAEAFFRRCREGNNALPIFEENALDAKHFGNNISVKKYANQNVLVLDSGWILDIGEC